jgi:hypothetical protein
MNHSRFFLDACGFYDDFKYDPKTISLYDKISINKNKINVKELSTGKIINKSETNVVVVQRNCTLLDDKPAIQINVNLLQEIGSEKIIEKIKKTKDIDLTEGEIRFIVFDKLSDKFFMLRLYSLGNFEIKEIFDNIESFNNVLEEVRALLSIALKEKVTILRYNYNRIIKFENHKYFKKFNTVETYHKAYEA